MQTARFFRFANIAMMLVFLLSAAVQYNDPDALPWITVYLAGAAVCLLPKHQRIAAGALLAVVLLWSIGIALGIEGDISIDDIFASLSMRSKEVEEAREIGGLLILAAWMSVLLKKAR